MASPLFYYFCKTFNSITMEQTTPKPRRGRKPAAKPEATTTAPKQKIKRKEVKYEAREFKALQS